MKEWSIHHYYNSIPVPSRLENDVLDENLDKIDHIPNLSKLNIFVGQNNSGKSILLREILKSDWKHFLSKDIQNYIYKEYETLSAKLVTTLRNHGITRFQAKNLNWYSTMDFETFIREGTLISKDLDSSISNINSKVSQIKTSFPQTLFVGNARYSFYQIKDLKNSYEKEFRNLEKWSNTLISNYIIPDSLKKVYCPTTRTLRKYPNTKFLEDKTTSEYEFADDISVSNGQRLFDEMKSILLDDFEIRKKKLDFEEFLSKEFFNNKQIIITPNTSRDGLTFKVGSEKEMPIYDLGEGLQMIILLTFPLFLHERGIIVIEEPEIFLHPSLQRRLMETLLHSKMAQNFLIFLSTHSNHILDVSNYNENVAIFSMKKIQSEPKGDNVAPQFIIRQLLKEKNSALELLGVKNTSVFLSNATIWVEGITDMLYIRAFMKNYLESQKNNSKHHICRNYKEGIHYSFVFSGGSNIIHFDFSDKPFIEDLKSKIVVKNLCGSAYVIVDDDNLKQKTRKARFFKELGGRFKVLPTVEVENLLSNDMIEKGVRSFSTCRNINFDLSNRLDEKEYSTIRMGTYIEKYLLKDDNSGHRKIFIDKKNQSKNQTVKSKLEFCLGVQPYISDLPLTSSANKLMKDLFDFLKDVNENNVH